VTSSSSSLVDDNTNVDDSRSSRSGGIGNFSRFGSLQSSNGDSRALNTLNEKGGIPSQAAATGVAVGTEKGPTITHSVDHDVPSSPSATYMYKRYVDFPPEEFAYQNLRTSVYTTAYDDATIIEQASPWFRSKRICKETCCATSVAMSLDQDDRHIINTLDGIDMADVLVRKYRYARFPDHHFFGSHLSNEIIPCLQPGTIIHIDNHSDILRYFFTKFKQNMTGVPYVLITSEADGDSPWEWGNMLVDDKDLIAWFGTSPKINKIPEEKREEGKRKFFPLPLGLSKQHDQDRYLSRLMELTNFTNPFADKERWTKSSMMTINNSSDLSVVDEVFYKSVYIRFNPNHAVELVRSSRGPFHFGLCDGYDKIVNKLDNFTCSTDMNKSPHDTYIASSRYLFGFSPPGVGFDCYRTYELLLVGVIPIVPYREENDDGIDQTHGLFDGLPVLQIRGYYEKNRTRSEYIQILRDYISSPEFQNTDFEAGWRRLFLRYWRRKILDLSGRTKDIMVDPRTGREFYQAWRYTTRPIERYGLTGEEELSIAERT